MNTFGAGGRIFSLGALKIERIVVAACFRSDLLRESHDKPRQEEKRSAGWSETSTEAYKTHHISLRRSWNDASFRGKTLCSGQSRAAYRRLLVISERICTERPLCALRLNSVNSPASTKKRANIGPTAIRRCHVVSLSARCWPDIPCWLGGSLYSSTGACGFIIIIAVLD